MSCVYKGCYKEHIVKDMTDCSKFTLEQFYLVVLPLLSGSKIKPRIIWLGVMS